VHWIKYVRFKRLKTRIMIIGYYFTSDLSRLGLSCLDNVVYLISCRKHFPVILSFMTYHRVCNYINTTVPLVEQELLTLPEHLKSHPCFCRVRVTWSLVLYVCFIDRCLSFCTFSFGHCVVCSSSIYGFWLRLWYLQTLKRLHWYIIAGVLAFDVAWNPLLR
jgi:hypothetical protein